MQIPSVRARVEELINAPEDRIRAGIDAEFLMLRNRAASEDLDALEPGARQEIEARTMLLRERGNGRQRKQTGASGRCIGVKISASEARLVRP